VARWHDHHAARAGEEREQRFDMWAPERKLKMGKFKSGLNLFWPKATFPSSKKLNENMGWQSLKWRTTFVILAVSIWIQFWIKIPGSKKGWKLLENI
jgi:hypothetical protein